MPERDMIGVAVHLNPVILPANRKRLLTVVVERIADIADDA